VILAWAVLKERLSRLHLLGIVVAAIAIALIGGGTATG
jgi:drug/metabolite transporter (DMT)-like permease